MGMPISGAGALTAWTSKNSGWTATHAVQIVIEVATSMSASARPARRARRKMRSK
jgi:hypothetical protein